MDYKMLQPWTVYWNDEVYTFETMAEMDKWIEDNDLQDCHDLDIHAPVCVKEG